MNQDISIVPMDRTHLDALCQLERRSFSSPWSRAMLEEELENQVAHYLVAVDARGNVLGYAGLYVVLDEGYIANIAVCPDCRRCGIGTKLLRAFLRFGEERLSFLTLEVRASNGGAVSLYQKNGFEIVGARKNYYENPAEDAHIMTRFFEKGEKT